MQNRRLSAFQRAGRQRANLAVATRKFQNGEHGIGQRSLGHLRLPTMIWQSAGCVDSQQIGNVSRAWSLRVNLFTPRVQVGIPPWWEQTKFDLCRSNGDAAFGWNRRHFARR